MNCREARRRLSDYLDETLELSVRHTLSEHLEACSICREEHRLLAATRRLLSTYGESSCPVDLSYLATQRPVRARGAWFVPSLWRGLTVAGAALALAAVGWQWQRPAGEEALSSETPRVVVRDVAEVEELHGSFAVQQSLDVRAGLVLYAPDWADRAP
jgi:predicted anti-sigma-YlaC factor YlaD